MIALATISNLELYFENLLHIDRETPIRGLYIKKDGTDRNFEGIINHVPVNADIMDSSGIYIFEAYSNILYYDLEKEANRSFKLQRLKHFYVDDCPFMFTTKAN